MNRRVRRLAETRTERRAEIENYVGIPLTERQREKLQQLVDVTPVKSEEEVTALALELGIDHLLDANEELDRLAVEELDDIDEGIAAIDRVFQGREATKNPMSLSLTDKQQRKLQELVDGVPTKTEEEVAAYALEVGVDQLLRTERQLAGLEPYDEDPVPGIPRSSVEQLAMLARAFEVREQLKTPSSITVSLSTMDRYTVDQLVAATGLKLDEVVKAIVAKGIAALMKERGIERRKPRTIEVS